MPIRMTDDANQQADYVPSNGGGSRGIGGGSGASGGGCLTAFLPIILNLIFKKPLIGIPLLLVGGFFFFKMGLLGDAGTNSLAPLATGAEMK